MFHARGGGFPAYSSWLLSCRGGGAVASLLPVSLSVSLELVRVYEIMDKPKDGGKYEARYHKYPSPPRYAVVVALVVTTLFSHTAMPDTILVALYRIPQLFTLARFLVFACIARIRARSSLLTSSKSGPSSIVSGITTAPRLTNPLYIVFAKRCFCCLFLLHMLLGIVAPLN